MNRIISVEQIIDQNTNTKFKYRAWFSDNPRSVHLGLTKSDAIGKLIISHSSEMSISIHSEDDVV